MNCSDCDDLLIRRSIEPLAADEAARLDRHLDACAVCRQRAAGSAALLEALDGLHDDLHATPASFVFRPSQDVTTSRPNRSVVMSLMRAGLAIAAVWAMVVLVGHRDPGNPVDLDHPSVSQPLAQRLTSRPTNRSKRLPVIRTAHVVPWLGTRSDARTANLRGRVRLTVPAHMPRSTFSATKTPSILIRPRRTDNVDRDQDSGDLRGDNPVGAGPQSRRDARV